MKLSTAILALAALSAQAVATDARLAQHRTQRLRRQDDGGVVILGTSSMAAPAAASSPIQAAAVAAAVVTSSIAAAPTALAAAAAAEVAGAGAATASAAEPAAMSVDEGAAATTTSAAEGAKETGEAEKKEEGGGGGKAKAAEKAKGEKKAQGDAGNLDTTILQFASLAEQLESTLYAQAASAFSANDWLRAGFTRGQVLAITESLTSIGGEEATHEKVLGAVLESLGSAAVDTCKFDFSSILTDPITTMLSLAVIEQVGVAAYLGAAPLVSDKTILAAAGSILTTEARHQSLLSLLGGASPLQNPFDYGLSPQEVSSLINGFLKGCSSDDLGLKATETLVIANADKRSAAFSGGSRLAFASTTDIPDDAHCQFLRAGDAKAFSVQSAKRCVIPNNLDGSVWVYLTDSEDALPVDSIARSSAENLVAGPAHFFASSTKSVFGTTLFSDLSSLQISAQVNMAGVFNGHDLSRAQIGDVQATTVIIVTEVDVHGEGGNGRQRYQVGRKSPPSSREAKTRAASRHARLRSA